MIWVKLGILLIGFTYAGLLPFSVKRSIELEQLCQFLNCSSQEAQTDYFPLSFHADPPH